MPCLKPTITDLDILGELATDDFFFIAMDVTALNLQTILPNFQ
jgi:hypothetical protein